MPADLLLAICNYIHHLIDPFPVSGHSMAQNWNDAIVDMCFSLCLAWRRYTHLAISDWKIVLISINLWKHSLIQYSNSISALHFSRSDWKRNGISIIGINTWGNQICDVVTLDGVVCRWQKFLHKIQHCWMCEIPRNSCRWKSFECFAPNTLHGIYILAKCPTERVFGDQTIDLRIIIDLRFSRIWRAIEWKTS